MTRVQLGARFLSLCSLWEVAQIREHELSFALLWFSMSDSLSKEEADLLRKILTRKCVEVYCVGESSEGLHDLLDDMILELGHLDIITTWAAIDESLDDICFYFLHVAGGKPPELFAVAEESPELRRALEESAKENGV